MPQSLCSRTTSTSTGKIRRRLVPAAHLFWIVVSWLSTCSCVTRVTALGNRATVSRTPRCHQREPRSCQRLEHGTYLLSNKNSEPNTRIDNSFSSTLDRIGILAQPIVGISLISVATTGGGLPSGPFGLVGAVEGISYLMMLGFALQGIFLAPNNNRTLSQQLSLITLGLALGVLIQLIASQGCVPNAQPILDYSAYVRVCDVQQTPGFLGGQP